MDKLDIRKLKSKSGKKAASRRHTKWQAATFFTVILISVVALCVALVQSGAKNHPTPAGRGGYNTRLPLSAPPPAAPKVDVDPYLPASSAPRPKRTRSLASAYASADALARRFLAALATSNAEAIKAMRVTKEEFCDLVWPDLPSSRLPNVTCDWAWDQATLKSASGLAEMFKDHQGKRYEFLSLRFAKGTESYPSYTVHKEARLRVRDEAGAERELRLFGSMLEMDGRFKLFSFVVD